MTAPNTSGAAWHYNGDHRFTLIADNLLLAYVDRGNHTARLRSGDDFNNVVVPYSRDIFTVVEDELNLDPVLPFAREEHAHFRAESVDAAQQFRNQVSPEAEPAHCVDLALNCLARRLADGPYGSAAANAAEQLSQARTEILDNDGKWNDHAQRCLHAARTAFADISGADHALEHIARTETLRACACLHQARPQPC